MEYFTPADTPVKWSRIALGCWQLAPSDGWGAGPDPQEARAAVHRALDEGITTFDTAEGYGDGESERRLSKALGPRLNDVAIISKIWPDAELTLKAFAARLDQTLRNLGREYVDLYLMHWPNRLDTPGDNAALCELMEKLKQSGKARLVGISNFMAADLKKLGDGARVFSHNEVCYNLLDRECEGETLRLNQKHGVEYLAYSPLAVGLLTGRFSRKTPIDAPTRRHNPLFSEPLYSSALRVTEAVQEVAAEWNATPAQVALAWVLHQPNVAVAIAGSRKPDQIAECAGAARIKLSAGQLKKLTEASDRFLKR